jgi:leukotriene-A4 hydrolase
MLRFSLPLSLLVMALLSACSMDRPEETMSDPIYAMDHHSNARPEEAVITHLDLVIQVDMENRRIEGTASYDLRVKGGERVILDTDGLEILAVQKADGTPLEFTIGDTTILGRALNIVLPKGTERIVVRYRTGPEAKALQWLAARQTEGGEHPFLFTQGQAILTRTWIPIQDSPGIRFTYKANVEVPKELMAVMSASNPQERSADGRYAFRMDQPIPAYLIALAVGDLVFKPIGDRCGIYAEPTMVDKAAWEFADTEEMLTAAEALYGPYRWERYDVLVLPPSFPFGGMENPRLTFATPTIVAGDRSLTALIAHEMAHSWSGNLVTNATWNDFWLNEGFTVYFENRICEAMYGEDYARMHHLLGHQDLKATVARIEAGSHPADTHLRLDLEGRDPDDGMTDIAYEKGFALLKLIESKVGRERFDVFLRNYFDTFAFQSMTTDRFLKHLQKELLGPEKVDLDIAEWVDGPGIPSNAVIPVSDRFVNVEGAIESWVAGAAAKTLPTSAWTTHEWLHFLRNLPKPMSREQMTELDGAFGFTISGNAEVLAAWLDISIANDYTPAYERLDSFLTTVGRRKFLVPLYARLMESETGQVMAQNIYQRARPNYHAVSVRTIDEMLSWKSTAPPVLF